MIFLECKAHMSIIYTLKKINDILLLTIEKEDDKNEY